MGGSRGGGGDGNVQCGSWERLWWAEDVGDIDDDDDMGDSGVSGISRL